MQLNRIAAAGLGQVMSRIFGLPDQNAIANVAPEIMPTTSPWERDEFWVLTGGNLCWTTTNIISAGGAATRVIAQLRNPTNSGMLLILERFDWLTTSGVLIGMNTISGLNTPGTAGDVVHRDARRAPGNNVLRGIAAQLLFQAITTAGLVTPTHHRLGPTGSYDRALVIPPAWAFQISCITDNEAATFDFTWREKPLASAEQLTY